MSVKVTTELTNLAKAKAAWGEEMPEWINLLATACDRSNQKAVGEQLEKSGGYVSRVLNRVYTGSYKEAEQLVMSRLAASEVVCPVWSCAIPLTSCREYRRRKGPPGTQIERLYARACPRCPNNTDLPGEHA